MPGVVIEVGQQVDGPKLRVDHIILLRLEYRILQSPVSAQSDRQRNAIDVPAPLQPTPADA